MLTTVGVELVDGDGRVELDSVGVLPVSEVWFESLVAIPIPISGVAKGVFDG